MSRRIYLATPPKSLDIHNRPNADLSYCVAPSLITTSSWYRNINLLSIIYTFRSRLRFPTYPERINLAQGNLRLTVSKFFTLIYATYACIITSNSSM